MPPQSTENKFKILVAALSQSANSKNDFLPTPDYNKLAEDLGLPSYRSAQGVWRRLVEELKNSTGDLKIRDPTEQETPRKQKPVVKESKAKLTSPAKKRVAEELDGDVESDSSPTKRSRVNFAKRGTMKGTDKEKNGNAIKSELGWMDNQSWSAYGEA